MLVVCLVEKDILAVSALLLGGVFFQSTILGDAVLSAEMLPEMRADLVADL